MLLLYFVSDTPSLHFLDVVKLPGLVEIRLARAVEPEDRKPAFTGNGFDPVTVFLRLIGTEGDVEGPVGVGGWPGVAAERGKRLPVL